VSADGQLVAAGLETGKIKVWAADTGEELAAVVGHTGTIWGVGISADGHLLASGGFDATVRLWRRPLVSASVRCGPSAATRG
jgi:WD40 repeat protein